MQQKIKILIVRSLLLAGCLIVLDQVGGRILEHYYRQVRSGSEYKTIYALEESREDLVIMGSSRAYHHYVPALMEERLGMKCYNLGRDGAGVLYNYAVYRTICDRKAPKVVVVDLHPEEFIAPSISYQLLYHLVPHYNENSYIREVVNLRSRFECLKVQSRLYRYNSQLFYIALNNIQQTGIDSAKGYLPLEGTLTIKPEQGRGAHTVDTLLVRYFEKFLEEARKHNTRVVVCISPVYRKYDHTTSSVEAATRLCNKYQIPLLDFSREKQFLDHPELFRDITHLNDKGAHLYTGVLVQALQDLAY